MSFIYIYIVFPILQKFASPLGGTPMQPKLKKVWHACSSNWKRLDTLAAKIEKGLTRLQPKLEKFDQHWEQPKKCSPGSSGPRLWRICCMPSAPREVPAEPKDGFATGPIRPMVLSTSAWRRRVASCFTSSVSISVVLVDTQNLVSDGMCGQSGSATPFPLATMALIFSMGISRLCISDGVKSSRLDWCVLAFDLLKTKSASMLCALPPELTHCWSSCFRSWCKVQLPTRQFFQVCPEAKKNKSNGK